jgi:hypothetical protein
LHSGRIYLSTFSSSRVVPSRPGSFSRVGWPGSAQAYRLAITIAQFEARLVVIGPIVSFLSEDFDGK